eukprot:m.47478 g.47478  ORF g.47478 m.47478 type:complete len:818 (+) comp33794_c0_seq2:104-2557(+)
MGNESSKGPGARRGHEAITDAHRMFVWGGERLDPKTGALKLCSKQNVHILDLANREWNVCATKAKGAPPPSAHGRCAAIGPLVYSYGGVVNLKQDKLTGEFHRFDTTSLTWAYVDAGGRKPAPRSNCGLCALNEQLVLFGGYVDKTAGNLQQGALWIGDDTRPGSGWTNECYCFDAGESLWFPLKTVGAKPHPRCGHTLNVVSSESVALFGGRSAGGRLNDLLLLNLYTKTWTSVRPSLLQWPPETSSHTALVFPPKPGGRPAVTVLGGLKDSEDESGCYRIDIETGIALQFSFNRWPVTKHLHSASWALQRDGTFVILVYGGYCSGRMLDDLLAYRWSPASPSNLECVYPNESPARPSRFPTPGKYEGTLMKASKRKSSKELQSLTEELLSENETLSMEKATLQQDVEQLSSRVRSASMASVDSQREVSELKDHLQAEMIARKEDEDRHRSSASHLLAQLKKKDEELEQERRGRGDEIEQLRKCMQMLNNHITTLKSREELLMSQLKTSRESLEEYERKLSDFVSLLYIPQEQVIIDESKKLGEGSFGAVHAGSWKGGQIAVKRFFTLIMHDHTERLCRQELSICCRIRHPNIVTVYGASMVNETPLLILMEFLEGALSEVIAAARASGRYLTHREQLDLADGAVAGIAYLHDLNPAYVHGDIKMGNVLVTRAMAAKIGDLGASHVLGDSLSAGALSVNYAAPERIGDSVQASTLATDIYSLGVTLGEIFTGEAAARESRYTQLASISHVEMQDLCTRMVVKEQGGRPSAWIVHDKICRLKIKEEYDQCPQKRLVIGKSEHDLVTLVDRVAKIRFV